MKMLLGVTTVMRFVYWV